MPPQLQVPRGVSSQCPALSRMVQVPVTLSLADLRAENGLMWLSSGADGCGISDTAHAAFLSRVSCLSSLRVMRLTWSTFHSVLEDCSVYKCLHLPATCSLLAHYHNAQRHTHALSWSLKHKSKELSVFQWLTVKLLCISEFYFTFL